MSELATLSPLRWSGLNTAADVCRRFEFLVSDRWRLEAIWRDVTALFYPLGPRWEDMESRGGRTMDPVWQEARSARRGRHLYDSTAIQASGRLSAGMESMITPQAQKWHSLDLENEFAETDDGVAEASLSWNEEVWRDKTVNLLFKTRYDPRSGWLRAHQNALYSTVALGTGVYFAEENPGSAAQPAHEVPTKYITIPLNEVFLQINSQLEYDTCFRFFKLSAKQAVAKFGQERVSQMIREKAADPAQMDQRYDFLHAVYPARELSSRAIPGNKPYASMYVEMDTKHEIAFNGFWEFPYIVYTWNLVENQPYGEAPSFTILPEAKTLQLMARDEVLASQNNIRPAVATAFELERAVNLNPGMINPNMIDPSTGRPLIQRIIEPVDPRMWEATIDARRQRIMSGMYMDLFAVSNDTEYRTATEVAIRDAEKAELLGPAASRIQSGLANLVERELGILERKGAFRPGSAYAVPDTIAERGAGVNVRFTGPIDRARRMSEVTGMQQTVEFAAMLGQIKPEVFQNLDADSMLRNARVLFGAPATSVRDPEVVADERKRSDQQQQSMGVAEMMQQSGEAAKSLGEGATAGAQGMNDLATAMAGSGIDPSMLTGVPGLTSGGS